MSKGSQGRRGIGCSLAKHEEPIDASHYVEDPKFNVETDLRRQHPYGEAGGFVVMYELPGRGSQCIRRYAREEDALAHASRLNAELRADDPRPKPGFAFYWIDNPKGVSWIGSVIGDGGESVPRAIRQAMGL